MARKAPSGPKHDRCIDHAEHPYPAKGMLCIGSVIGREGMIAFADELAGSAAQHRAAFLADVDALHVAARPNSRKAAKRSAGGFAHVPELRKRTDVGLAELVARYAAMRGRTEPVFARAPVRKPARPVVERPARVVAEPIAEAPAAIDPHVIVGMDAAEDMVRDFLGAPAIARDTYAAAVELAETRPDPCEACGHPAHGATCATCDDAAQVGTYAPCAVPAHWPMPVEDAMRITQALREIPRDDARVAAAVLRASAPAEPCAFVGCITPASIDTHHGGNGGPAHMRVTAAERAEWAQPEPVAEPAPVLRAPAERPTCPRCGQSFRVKGTGRDWHVANRPDCARVAVAV